MTSWFLEKIRPPTRRVRMESAEITVFLNIPIFLSAAGEPTFRFISPNHKVEARTVGKSIYMQMEGKDIRLSQ